MNVPESLDHICGLLAEQFGDLGEEAARRLRLWMSGDLPFTYPEVLAQHLREDYLDLLIEVFWQELPFGTGGRRGPVGYGANRINLTTVVMTVQGHCNHLREAFPDRRDMAVVVANDVRVFHDIAGIYKFLGSDHPLLGVSSRSLARLACEVYAGNGIATYINEPDNDDALMTTPMLSYLINELKAIGGINLSASHNPPDDNGVKVYDQFGSQPVAPQDQHLSDAMAAVRDVRMMDFEKARQAGMIRGVPAEYHEKYLKTYKTMFGDLYQPQPNDPPIVYTPLCGCGLTNAGTILTRLGFHFQVPPGQGPDGTFNAIPLKAPNPEVPQSTKPAKVFADEIGSSIVLCSDPDADRVGLEVKLEDGTWYHFDGDQIAAVLTYYLMLDPEGPRMRGLVIETLVTTKLLGAIVARAENSWIVDDLLVGFKYLSDVLKQLDDNGHYKAIKCSSEDLVIATEESHGIAVIPTIRDKDSAPACMYLAALQQRLHHGGSTLLDYYAKILEEVGSYDTMPRSIMMTGVDGMLKKDQIMNSIREKPFEAIGGQRVHKVVDYWDQDMFGPFLSETEKLPRNVVQFFLDSYVVTIRPSGTEPKLKLYCQLLPHEDTPTGKGRELLRKLREKTEVFAKAFYNDLLNRIELSLDEAALLLPDIIDLDNKIHFQEHTLIELKQALEAGRFNTLDSLLAWLETEVAPMTPGANPLPAIKAPIAYVTAQWAGKLENVSLLTELQSWAAQ